MCWLCCRSQRHEVSSNADSRLLSRSVMKYEKRNVKWIRCKLQIYAARGAARCGVAAAAAKAIQIEAGDHWLQLPQAHFDCDCDCGGDCGFSGSSLRSCCTFHRRQSAGLLWQQMPVAQMPDIKGKSSASCDSTCFDLLRRCCCCRAVKLKHQSKHFGITLHQQNILYISTYMYISYAQSRGKTESKCHLLSVAA